MSEENNHDTREELLEAYLLGHLSAPEAEAFEGKLKTDPALQKQLDELRTFIQGVQYAALTDLKQRAEVIVKKHSKPPSTHRWKWIIVGIGLVLILAGLLWFGYLYFRKSPEVQPVQENNIESQTEPIPGMAPTDISDSLNLNEAKREEEKKDRSKSKKSAQLFALATEQISGSFTEDFNPGSSISRQSGSAKDSLLFLAGEAFDNKNWVGAIDAYKRVNDLTDRSSAFAKLGMAYLQNNQLEDAISVFRNLKEKSPLPEWQQKAQWYLLLTYLYGGEKYVKEFEAEMKAALGDPSIRDKMRDRFTILNKRYNILWFLAGMVATNLIEVSIGLNGEPGDTTKIRALIYEAEQFNKEKKYKEAIEKAQAASDLAKSSLLEESLLNADAILQCANAQYSMADFKSALQSYHSTIEIRQHLIGGNNIQTARIYNNIALTFRSMNLLDSALVYYQLQLTQYKVNYGEQHAQVAVVLSNIGETYLYKRDFTKSISYYDKALEIFENDAGSNEEMVGKIYNNLVYVYQSTGDFNKSIKVGNLALKIWTALKGSNSPEVGLVIMNIGNTYRDKGDFINAADSLRKAVTIFQRSLGAEHQNVGRAYNGLGLVFESTGDIEKALEYYQKTLLIILKNYGANDPAVASVYQNLGNTYRKLGNFEKSIESFARAIEINISAYGENSRSVSINYSGMGNTYGMMNNLDEAERWHLKSLGIKQNLKDTINPSVAADYHNLGKVYYSRSNAEKSILSFQKSLKIKKTLGMSPGPNMANTYATLALAYGKAGMFNEGKEAIEAGMAELNFKDISHIEDVNSKTQLLEALKVKGRLYFDWYTQSNNEEHLAISFQSYLDGVSVIDYQRKYLDNPGSKISLSRESVEIYEGAIRTACLRKDFHSAFTFAEKSKSMALFELIRQSEALHFGEIPDSLLRLEYRLRVEMISLSNKRQDLIVKKLTEADSELLVVNSALFDLSLKFESLIDRFEQKYPNYSQIKFNLGTASVIEIKDELLMPNTTLLEYFAGDSSIFILGIQKSDYRVFDVKRNFPLKEWVEQMREGIEVAGTKDPLDSDRILGPQKYVTAAHALYQKLIAPVDSFLTDNVIIIPDAELGWIPFEALLADVPVNPADFSSYQYLVRKHTISYAPSATLRKEMQEEISHDVKPNNLWLGLAPFSDQPSYPVLDSLFIHNNIASRGGVERLPHSGEEIAIISKLTNGRAVYDAAASSDYFRHNAGSYRILHLSQHARAERKIGDYSYLLFPDTLLYVRDIYNLQLNADMVVLSACETGFGELRRGEGIIGMTRAFTYAGAKSLFTTLWAVNDEATRDLTVHFYKHMMPEGGKLPKDEALRKSKLDMIEKGGTYAHPYYWAGMIGIGDMRALDLKL